MPTTDDRRRVLLLVHRYRHLDGANLDTLPTTDLIQHRVRLVKGTKPSGSSAQRRRPFSKEWWLQKLITDGLNGGVYERTQSANRQLSDWNAQAVLVDKIENPTPADKPRLTFS